MLTWDDVRSLAADLPGTEVGTSYGTPALKVKGKLFVRIHDDGDSLVVKCDPFDRDFLTALWPDRFYFTPHYRDYPWVLVRMAVAGPEDVRELVAGAWRMAAPKRVVAEWDAARR